MVNLKIFTKDTFSKSVLELIEKKKMTAMDAVVLLAEQNNIEIESAAKLIDKSLKEKIESEASQLNLMRKTDKLPI